MRETKKTTIYIGSIQDESTSSLLLSNPLRMISLNQ